MAKIDNGAGAYAELTGERGRQDHRGRQGRRHRQGPVAEDRLHHQEAGAYPIVLVTYEIVCSKGNAADKLPLLKAFLTATPPADGPVGS